MIKIFNSEKIKEKRALLMSNDMESCQEDLKRLEKMLDGYTIIKKSNCYPRLEIIGFLKKNPEFCNDENNLLHIHYSGHGVKRGRNVNGNTIIISSWVNPNGGAVISHEIDSIISRFKCNILLTTDSCHSETFLDTYTGNRAIFIGTSKLSNVSKTYAKNGDVLHGSLVYLFEYMIRENIEINLENIILHNEKFYKNNEMETTLIIKKFLEI